MKAKQKITLVSADTETTHAEMLEEQDLLPDKMVMDSSLKLQLAKVLERLSEQERDILLSYYGIGRRQMTLNELAKRYGRTSENMRQIKEKALRKLKSKSTKDALRPFMD